MSLVYPSVPGWKGQITSQDAATGLHKSGRAGAFATWCLPGSMKATPVRPTSWPACSTKTSWPSGRGSLSSSPTACSSPPASGAITRAAARLLSGGLDVTRKKITSAQRVKVFLKTEGACYLCHRKIGPGELWDVEHELALALGGKDDFSNWFPAHADCHRGKGGKTANDIKMISKADRVAKKNLGIRPKNKSIPGSKASGWKRKLDGTVERRT